MFVLRIDLQTEIAGIFSIIKQQETEWVDIDVKSWEEGKIKARKILKSYPSKKDTRNFIPCSYCQGGVLMKKDGLSNKKISFILN